MTFKQDDDFTPVLFRRPRGKREYELYGVTAVFPYEPGTDDSAAMSCYAHIGQHASCGLSWYRSQRPATPAEYADLKRELESAPYGYRLKVYTRMPPNAHHERRKALERMK